MIYSFNKAFEVCKSSIRSFRRLLDKQTYYVIVYQKLGISLPPLAFQVKLIHLNLVFEQVEAMNETISIAGKLTSEPLPSQLLWDFLAELISMASTRLSTT